MSFFDSIWQWAVVNRALSIAALVVASYFAIILLAILYRRFGFYSWYLLTILVGLLGAATTQRSTYFIVFLLGVTTAFAEIISKFRDEPLKALAMPHALVYHLLNGAIAAFALKCLILFGVPFATPVDRFRAVLAAGFGSMLVMRSKLFNIKVGGEDISFGPEQIIKIYFRFMEAAIDRIRAQARIEFVRSKLGHVNPDKVFDYCVTMLLASQALEEKARKDCLASIKELRKGEFKDIAPELKSYRLGFMLLDNMGEDFVTQVFKDIPSTWFLAAPIPKNVPEDSLVHNLSKLPLVPSVEKPIPSTPYFAYGSSMSSERFRNRLGPGWKEMNDTLFRQITKPNKAVLEGYRLEFASGSPGDAAAGKGFAHVIPGEATDKVEGVIYQLSEDAIKYLDLTEPGYHREKVKIKVDGKELESYTYVSKPGGLSSPTEEYLREVMDGAREFELSDAYQKQIQQQAHHPSQSNAPQENASGNGADHKTE